MSREIKFRAWNRNTNKMVDCYATTRLALDPSLQQDGLFLPFSDKFILEQYTGLKDSKGVEIYEGDILSGYQPIWGGRALPVEWNKNGWWLNDNRKMVGVYAVDTALSLGWKVIGNIHENPELLKSTEGSEAQG